MNPSGAIVNPEPLPPTSRGPRRPATRCLISMLTTDGATRSTALTTGGEYSSSNAASLPWDATLHRSTSGIGRDSCNRDDAKCSRSSEKVKVFINEISELDHLESTTHQIWLYQ